MSSMGMPDAGNQGTPIPVAQPTSAPQTQAPQTNAQPNAAPPTQAPQTNAQPNAQPTVQAQPLSRHTGIFDRVMGVMAGGGNRPVMGANGQPVTDANGQVQMAPASKKTLGMSILAGALSGMMAGYAAPTERTPTGAGRSVPNYGPSLAAGASASQPFTQASAQQKAQGDMDQQKTRAFATMDHNLKIHAAQLNNEKLQGTLLQDSVDDAAPIIAGLALADPITDPNDPTKTINPIQGSNVTSSQLQEMMNSKDPAARVTRDSVFPDGVANVYDKDGKQVMNSDGTPAKENTYTVYNHNAMVAMTDQMRGLSPNLKDVATGTALPVAVLARYARENSVSKAASFGIQNQLKEYDDSNKTTTKFDLNAAMQKNPIIKSILPQIGKYGTDSIDAMFKDLRADKTVSPAALGALQTAMGVTDQGLEQVANDRKTASEAAAMKGKEKHDAMAAPQEQVDSFRQDIGTAYPNLTDGQKDLLTKSLGKNPTNGDYEKMQDRAEKYSESNTKMVAEKLQNEPTDPKLVQMIGTGHFDVDRLGYILAKNPALLAAVSDAYPDWDNSKVKSYAATYKDYTSGKSASQLRAGNVALQHLAELKDLNTLESRVPGTKDYNAFHSKLDTLAAELGSFYGANNIPDIEGYKKTLGATFNRDEAIRTQAKSMGDRLDEFENTWRTAAPSASYEARMPGISDKGRAARHKLDPDYTYEPDTRPKPSETNPPTAPAPSRPAPPAGFTPIA